MLGLTNIFKYKKTALLLILMSCVLYSVFAYSIDRTDTFKLVTIYTALFFLAYYIIKTSGFYFRILVIASVLFRLSFLFALPNLSQDFYRFIWDGQMILSGLNPYLTTPDYQMALGALSNFPNQVELYNGMGALSASHFTNYPPLNQLCFVFGNLFPGTNILSSVVGMRLLIIAADLGTLYFGKKLLERLKLPATRIFWYILNPFIIIELTGNIHFEGVMLFFIVWSMYLLHLGKWKRAAIIFACSVSVKLLPLMFLPLFFWWFKKDKYTLVNANEGKEAVLKNEMATSKVSLNGIPKLMVFYCIVGITTILLFLPFFSKRLVTNYVETVGLWFGDFEFNASIYYLARNIGYAITGYNEIAIIATILPVIALLIILGLSLLRKNDSFPKLMTSMLLAFTYYLFLSTTIHPWYLATPVLLCLFTQYRFPLIWSLVVVLSYLSYLDIGTSAKSENLWIVGLEYLIVYFYFIWEIFTRSKGNTVALAKG